MRDRFIEVIKDISKQPIMLDGLLEWADDIADELIDYGAIMPPCKIGQICYKVWEGKIFEVRVVSISYEINRLVGRYDNALTKVLTAPGQWFQNFTTNEPDDEMIEVGIAALKAVLPEKEGEDRW